MLIRQQGVQGRTFPFLDVEIFADVASSESGRGGDESSDSLPHGRRRRGITMDGTGPFRRAERGLVQLRVPHRRHRGQGTARRRLLPFHGAGTLPPAARLGPGGRGAATEGVRGGPGRGRGNGRPSGTRPSGQANDKAGAAPGHRAPITIAFRIEDVNDKY